MSVTLKLPGDGSGHFEAHIPELPSLVVLPAPKSTIFAGIFMGGIFSFIGYSLFSASFTNDGPFIKSLLGLGIGCYGAFTLAQTLLRPKNKVVMRFGRYSVEVNRYGFLRSTKWQSSYDSFKGVASRVKETPSAPQKDPYQIIELIHEDPAKTLPLYAVRRPLVPTEQVARYAEIFHVPIIENEALDRSGP